MDGEAGPEGSAAPAPASPALRGTCPRCGAPTLFAGYVRFADRCTACGLDFTRYNVGDGPAAFLTTAVGTVIVGLGIWLELAIGPPAWVHIVLWTPLTLLGVLGSLRLAKAALLHAEYRNAAREGRRSDVP